MSAAASDALSSGVQDETLTCRYMRMRHLTLRIALVYSTLVVVFVGLALPAQAGGNLSSLHVNMNDVVQEAQAEMQTVLNQFTIEATQVTTLPELLALQTEANSEINIIRDAAFVDLDSYLSAYPTELASHVLAAKSQINTSAAAAHDEITTTTDQIAPTLAPVTTTTTVPPTTTTTTTATTTTTVPRTTTTTTAPRTKTSGPTTTTTITATTTTTDPRTTTTTTVPTTTTTTTTVAAAFLPTPPTGSDALPDAEVDYALTPPPVFETASTSSRSISDTIRSESGMVTAAIVDGMSVVLPPSVAAAVLSLPIVIEIIIGTLFTSMQSLILPILVLLAAVAVLVWWESRSGDRTIDPAG